MPGGLTTAVYVTVVYCVLRYSLPCSSSIVTQEMWANAHETRDSISLTSYAACLGLSPVISTTIHSKCASLPEIATNLLKNLFWVQGRLRSSVLIPPESSLAVLVMISSKSVSICNRSHGRRANSGEIIIFRGYPFLMPSIEGNLLTQRHEICSQETRDFSYHLHTVKTRSLYLTWA